MGFQAFNGTSCLAFPENSRSHNMMFFIGEIRKQNLINKEIIPYIDCVLQDSSVNRFNVVGEYNIQSMGKEKFSKKIKDISKKKGYKKRFKNEVTKLIHNEKKNTDFDIDEIIRFRLLENLESINIKSLLEDEKEIVIVLDNYKPHHNPQFKKFCELLKIKLIYLPAYTPQYNPIEQVWKSIKRIIYDPTISTIDELIRIFKEEYFKIIYNKSFYKKWMEKFLL